MEIAGSLALIVIASTHMWALRFKSRDKMHGDPCVEM